MNSEAHWDKRYRTNPHELSWHQDVPAMSLALLDALGIDATASVIDVGGGASTLVDRLLQRGHTDVAVLDVSERGLAVARARVGDAAGVTWVHHDLLTWSAPRRWDVWHDRAVLHFLVHDRDRAAYVDVLRRVLVPGGAFVIGTFAEDGPTQCSGLPVRRNSAADLLDLLGDVEVVAERREVHITPGGAQQPFTWIAGRVIPSHGSIDPPPAWVVRRAGRWTTATHRPLAQLVCRLGEQLLGQVEPVTDLHRAARHHCVIAVDRVNLLRPADVDVVGRHRSVATWGPPPLRDTTTLCAPVSPARANTS